MASSTNQSAESKKPADVSCDINTGARTVTFTFGDDGESIVFRADSLTADLFTMACLHGLKQKIGDAGAISRNPETGRSATIADKRAAMQEVADRLLQGQWNKVREGGNAQNGSLLLLALMELRPNKTREQLQAYISGLSDKDQATLRASSNVKPIIERIKADRAKVPADADAIADRLLADLD